MSAIRVLLVDDHAIVRFGLRQLLSAADDIAVQGEAADGPAALRILESTPVDVTVLDLSLPRIDGSEVLRRIRERHPNIGVVVLSMYPEEQHAQRMLRAGAGAYLSKDRPPAELLAAIRAVARGERYVTESMASRSAERGGELPPHQTLTGREHQIFTLILRGRTVGEIAAELDLSASTVSNHLRGVKTKLSAETIAEIVNYAHRVGMID